MILEWRIVSHQINVVRYHHEVAGFEFRIHPPARIRDNERLDPKGLHQPDRKGDLLHRISFIKMKSALHCHDVLRADPAKDQLVFVTRHRRNRN